MKSKLHIMVAMVALFGLSGQETFRSDVQLGQVPIPEVIDVDGSGGAFPIWLSARANSARSGAFVAPGTVLGNEPSGRRMFDAIQGRLEIGKCLELEGRGPGGRGGLKTLSELVHRSAAVVSGTVTGIDGGFAADLPALLVQIRVDEWLKPHPAFLEKDRVVHFIHSRGNFSLNGLNICQHRDGVPAPPKVGERVLLFPHGVPYFPMVTRAYVDVGGSNDYGPIIGSPSGFRAPETMDQIAELAVAVTFDQLEVIIRAIVKEGRAQ